MLSHDDCFLQFNIRRNTASQEYFHSDDILPKASMVYNHYNLCLSANRRKIVPQGYLYVNGMLSTTSKAFDHNSLCPSDIRHKAISHGFFLIYDVLLSTSLNVFLRYRLCQGESDFKRKNFKKNNFKNEQIVTVITIIKRS